MVALTNSYRWPAVSRLQFLTGKLSPGTETFENLDHALSLALSPRRTSHSPWLLRNLRSDARRIRSRQRRMVQMSSLYGPGENGDGDCWDVVSHEPTPPEIAEANELERNIRARAARLAFGESCFDGMLAGESTEESSVRLGISTRRVVYVRAKIRMIAGALSDGGCGHVAA